MECGKLRTRELISKFLQKYLMFLLEHMFQLNYNKEEFKKEFCAFKGMPWFLELGK